MPPTGACGRPDRPLHGPNVGPRTAHARDERARIGLTLAESGPYARPSHARSCVRAEQERVLATRGFPRRSPTGERQYHIGLGPGEAGRVHPPPRGPGPSRADRRSLRLHRGGRIGTASSRAQPGSTRASGSPRCPPASARTTSRSCSRRSCRSASGPRSSGSDRAARCRTGWRSGTSSISTGSVRLDDDRQAGRLDDGYPAVAHYECVLALEEAATRLGHRHHQGLTATRARVLRRAGTPDRATPHPLP